MKRCLSCSTCFDSHAAWTCPTCNWAPEISNNLTLFCNNNSDADAGYDPTWYKELATLEEKNFWFKARNNLIHWLVKRHCQTNARYLELGCGTCFMLGMISQVLPSWQVSGSEVHTEGLQLARKRVGSDVNLYQMDARAIPYCEEFNVIGAFDVLEHIKDDKKVLSEIHTALKPGGIFIMSVPQHMFLWSQYDEIGYHFRRYSISELRIKVNAAGFKVVETTSFNSILLPLMALSRVFKRDQDKAIDVLDELRIPGFINNILYLLLSLELAAIKLGVRWPFGGSRIVIARKA